MRVILDVGAHIGQTLCVAQSHKFDRIVCFEPVSANIAQLRKLADKRTRIEPFGLWNKTASANIYDPGSQGGSLWMRPGRSHKGELCSFVQASAWVRENIAPDDEVWMKLNAEGAELDIINDLIDSGEIAKIDYLLVMWDAGKIPELTPRLAAVKERLAPFSKPRVMDSKAISCGKTFADRINVWLKSTGVG